MSRHGALNEGRSEPLGLPNPEPAIPKGVSGELLTDGNGKYFVRDELNDRWVSYAYFNPDGTLRRGVAMPRFEVFSADEIARFDAESAAEETQQT